MKVVRKENLRVEVYPASTLIDFESLAERCRTIVDQIERHVDHLEAVQFRYDTVATCSHCKLGWETETNGKPVCCDEAIFEFETQQQEAATV